MTDSRTAFLSAADTFVLQVAAISTDSLDGPGLGEWDLRALVGHTSRSLVTVETYLEHPADAIELPTAAAYYRAIAAVLGANDPAVTERGRQAGAALGDDPTGFVRDLARRVADKLTSYDDDYRLVTIAGGMRLDEYLREAHYRASSLARIDINGGFAMAHKVFDGTVRRQGGVVDTLKWRTIYLCRKDRGRWWIAGFVGYLPA